MSRWCNDGVIENPRRRALPRERHSADFDECVVSKILLFGPVHGSRLKCSFQHQALKPGTVMSRQYWDVTGRESARESCSEHLVLRSCYTAVSFRHTSRMQVRVSPSTHVLKCLCSRDSLHMVPYLHPTSFAVRAALAGFFVDSARRLECVMALLVVAEWHTEPSGNIWWR